MISNKGISKYIETEYHQRKIVYGRIQSSFGFAGWLYRESDNNSQISSFMIIFQLSKGWLTFNTNPIFTIMRWSTLGNSRANLMAVACQYILNMIAMPATETDGILQQTKVTAPYFGHCPLLVQYFKQDCFTGFYRPSSLRQFSVSGHRFQLKSRKFKWVIDPTHKIKCNHGYTLFNKNNRLVCQLETATK